MDIENFSIGLNIQNAFDIVVSNCQISGCNEGMRLESTHYPKIAGLIKLINGFCVNNSTHILVQGVAEASFDKILGFGWSCGHQHAGIPDTIKATGISSSVVMNGIILFGCHLEDLEYGIVTSSYTGMIDVQGCTFASIDAVGIRALNIGALSASGNLYSPTTKPFLDIPFVGHGVMLAGNQRSEKNIYPAVGLIEANYSDYPPKIATRISLYSMDDRPDATQLPIGSMIFNTSTNKINVSDGTGWLDPDGMPAS